ncbi:D-alanyl-D-alanine carboxypeptidase family protein [Basilea psittacipulmonis]|uniref:serine-type D-Ala-D-Ala carboxypeptidase n=1 Tax=Basilea psittacipulmonis DSM 24701 TaxID=1072685 RepID=A0A077DEZ7_9BURK|nr:D-alanyl-D-alanine carboxypeptidase family protein [Basilea psittacipulmonis]AIL32002.1 cytochrome C550 [Basilea psittacipulmonis DSM 24701]
MKKIKLLVLILVLVVVAVLVLTDSGQPVNQVNRTVYTTPSAVEKAIQNADKISLSEISHFNPPQVNAKAWMLLDVNSGQVLAGQNANERVAPASLTKLMTASLVFSAIQDHRISLDQKVTISERAWRTGGSRMFIEVNKTATVGELLQGLIVQSGNDAAVQLAELVGGSVENFVLLMNKRAKEFGMNQTHYDDPTGLPSDTHYTTVHDLAILAQHMVKDYPEFYHYFSQQSFTFNKISQSNRNGLLFKNLGVDGLKTGHTDDAGYCLIATALRNDRRVISIVVGADSIREREQMSETLLNWAYGMVMDKEMTAAKGVVAHVPVLGGQEKTVAAGSLEAVVLSYPVGQDNKISVVAVPEANLYAPVKKGEILGQIEYRYDDKVLKTEPLVALEDMPQAGFFGRLWDRLLNVF